MKEEFYDIAFRKKIYHTVEEIQADVNEWLKKYNELRPHCGRYGYGKTPMQTFLDAKALVKKKQLDLLFQESNHEESKLGIQPIALPAEMSEERVFCSAKQPLE